MTEMGKSLGGVWTFQDRGISSVFTSWGASGCMDCGWLLPARLEYRNYRWLACAVWLVDHGLDYSPPRVNEPAEEKEKGEEDMVRKQEEDRKGQTQRNTDNVLLRTRLGKNCWLRPWKSWLTARKQTHCQTNLFLLANHNSDMEKWFFPKQAWAPVKPS